MLYPFFYVICVGFALVSSEENGAPCTTPNGEKAKCISINSCEVIQQSIRYLEDDAIEFAKQSQCGYDVSALVCCGTVGKFVDFAHTTTTTRPKLYERPADPSYKAEPVTHILLPPGSLCGRQSKKNQHTGKTDTESHEYPWLATLNYKKKSDGSPAGSLCSGSLINHRYVLTAAACLDIEGYELTNIHLGEWNFNATGENYDYYVDSKNNTTVKRRQDYDIIEKISHPYFNKKSGNNGIALVRIKETIQYNDYISPICLPPKNFPPPLVGGPMETGGWTTTPEGFLTGIKQKANYTMISVEECNSTYANFTYNFPNKICVKTGENSTIEDSGRPLVRLYVYDPTDKEDHWFQEGILFKDVSGNKGPTNVLYMRVARYLTWILNNLKKS